MFCTNCGKQIPDNTNFCIHCGAQQPTNSVSDYAPKTTANQSQPVEAKKQPTKKGPKKKASIMVALLVGLCAFLLGKFIIAPSMMSDSDKETTTRNHSSQTQQATENKGSSTDNSSNPAYDAIFEDTYIVHFPTFFNMEMKNFVLKQDDGTICCSDYGYENDTVKQFVETMYIPVAEYTDTQKTELENTIKTQFATIETLSCCSVRYNMSENYFTVTCTYSDVDKAENYAELYNAEILQTNTFISMSATEETLLNQGFIKK